MLVFPDGSRCITSPTLSKVPQGTRLCGVHVYSPIMESLRLEPGVLLSMVRLAGHRKTLPPDYRYTD